MKQRLHPIEIILMLAAALILTSGAVALHTQSELADKVVRLHVLANSDSEEDQALKLKVRDAVLAKAAEALEGAGSREEACRRLTAILPELEETAKTVISANGYDYGIRAELAETAFPTKDYDGFSLPAGEYLALRVLIGEAAGRNWWCVVFPPLCLIDCEDSAYREKFGINAKDKIVLKSKIKQMVKSKQSKKTKTEKAKMPKAAKSN